jgi:hypothetical protein
MDPFGILAALLPGIPIPTLQSTLRGLYRVALTEGLNQTQTARLLGTNRRTLQRAVESDFTSLRRSTMESMLQRQRAQIVGGWTQQGRTAQRLDTTGYTQSELQSLMFPPTQRNVLQFRIIRTFDPEIDETPSDYVTDVETNEADYRAYIDSIDTEGNPKAGTITAIVVDYMR